jgi:hypothetical protein
VNGHTSYPERIATVREAHGSCSALSDPRPPYVEAEGKRSLLSGVLGLLLVPTFMALVWLTIPGQTRVSRCACPE